MSAIGTNIAALSVATYINQNNEASSRSISRLASGSRLAIPSDDAASVAVSGNLTARVARLGAASTVTQSVVSLAQTVDGFLSTIQSQLTRLGELAQEASNGSFGSADRANYQTEFSTLLSQINLIATSATFDGLSLFSAGTVTLAVNASGSTDSLVLSTVATATSLGLSAVSISTVTAATGAITLLTAAISCITSRRASVNADISKFNFYSTNIGYEQTNVISANSAISDVDIASESTKLSQSIILTKFGVSLLAQSNSNQKTVLGLLTPSASSSR
ncbi:flagellin [Verrucomicrobium sp. GAS474]|uniref:flagellin N-terminal helical domain-containing protein n=1 Tax=Verrucomicrobium sp. GAS474 TaxID=1882831 RepID=UPI00087D8611|nr:flagellin [Verrucomicrobium sp. GAS474]SDU00054.1 flagellin [Verrucomicrobium sp. GAS474]